MSHKAVIYFDQGGGWRYSVYARNGENIGGSESYTRRASALRALRKNRPDVGRITVEDRDGRVWKFIEG